MSAEKERCRWLEELVWEDWLVKVGSRKKRHLSCKDE